MARVHAENIRDLCPFLMDGERAWFFGPAPIFSEWYGYNQVAYGFWPEDKFGDFPALFYGVMNSESQWYIVAVMWWTALGSDFIFATYFAHGDSDFYTNWANRATLDYRDYTGADPHIPYDMF